MKLSEYELIHSCSVYTITKGPKDNTCTQTGYNVAILALCIVPANLKNIHMLQFNFILGSNFIFLCFKLITKMRYHTQKQRKIKFEPRIKLNHNKNIKVIYHAFKWINDVRRSLLLTIKCRPMHARFLRLWFWRTMVSMPLSVYSSSIF